MFLSVILHKEKHMSIHLPIVALLRMLWNLPNRFLDYSDSEHGAVREERKMVHQTVLQVVPLLRFKHRFHDHFPDLIGWRIMHSDMISIVRVPSHFKNGGNALSSYHHTCFLFFRQRYDPFHGRRLCTKIGLQETAGRDILQKIK